ncbi:MAG: hypothetical protein VX444_12900 [Pseudomonadota bacterium]|nr:hypothetical protein [Pseudomonadota bacterium]
MLDDKTEMIAHFIGIFELKTEEARLKIQYQEFTAQLADNPNFAELFNITVNMTSAYGLGGFMPDLKWPLAFVSVPVSNFSFIVPTAIGFAPFGFPAFFPTEFFNGAANGPSIAQTVFTIPIPSSLATITVQQNYLEDFDILNTYEGDAEFINVAAYNGGLEYLTDVADQLQVLRAPALATDEDAMVESAVALSEDVKALEEAGVEPAVEGAEIYAAFNGDINELTVNGEAVEEMPDLGDYSHRFATEEEEEEVEETNEAKSASGEVKDDDDLEEDQHEVSTGENLLLNEAYISTNWIDAPIISVIGKVVVADVISQINIWSDIDMINGALHSAEDGTNALNAAHFEYVSSDADEHSEDDGEETEEEIAEETEVAGDGPENVVVVTLEGNLINYNHVKQFNFANDGDIMSVGFSANDTMVQMGGNSLVNAASILGLGFHYDLIMVDGDMIDVAFLSQTNVMLDSDTLHYGKHFAGDVSTSDNLLMNWGKITNFGLDQHHDMAEGNHKVGAYKNDSVFDNVDLLRVLHVKGNLIDMQIVEQFNVLGDGDQAEIAAQTVQAADGANVSVTTGHNELLNMASITDAGLDSTIYTKEGAYTDAFLHQAEFVSEDDPLTLAMTDTLAGEAFLFLADGILDQDQGEDAGIYAPEPTEVAADVMQTVLA